MEHLENHPHAFLDENNKVFDVLVFNEHNHELINDIKNLLQANAVVCCCDSGLGQISWIWENNEWIAPPLFHEINSSASAVT